MLTRKREQELQVRRKQGVEHQEEHAQLLTRKREQELQVRRKQGVKTEKKREEQR
jgi:hypothetical protein